MEIRSPQRAGAIVRVCEMCRWYPKFCVACQRDERYNESRVSGYELQISCCTFNLTPSHKSTHLRFFTIVKKVAMSSWRWCRDSKGRKGGNSKYVKRGKPFSVGLLLFLKMCATPFYKLSMSEDLVLLLVYLLPPTVHLRCLPLPSTILQYKHVVSSTTQQRCHSS